MGLKPVPLCGCLAVIAHGDGQKVELYVRITDPGTTADEPAAFKIVRCPQSGLGKEPLRPDHRLRDQVPVLVERDRLLGGELDIHLQMVLQIAPDTGAIRNHIDAMLGQMRGRPDARQHEDLGRVDRRGGEDHLTPRPDRPATGQSDANRAPLFQHDALHEPAYQITVRAFERGLEVGVRGRPPPPLPDRLFKGAKPLLLLPVIVGGHRITCLPPRFDKGMEQRVGARPARDMQRTGAAPPGRIAAMPAIMPAFHPFVVGQHVGKGPTARASLRPMVKVMRMPTHIDHPVDRG